MGGTGITKSGNGNIEFKGLAAKININHSGGHGTVRVNGASAWSKLQRHSKDNNSLNNHLYFYGAGAHTEIKQRAKGNVLFKGAGIDNRLYHYSQGNIDFKGGGAANIVHHRGQGNIEFTGAGLGNIIDHYGRGNITFSGVGLGNIVSHKGASGNTHFTGGGGANIINHAASGNVNFNGIGLANVILHTGTTGNATINAAGALNVVIRHGRGSLNTTLAALGNIAIHLGDGDDRIFQLGGLNTYTRIGNGNTLLGLAGGLNVATFVGNGNIYGGLLGLGNVVTKVGSGNVYLAAAGAGNVISHINNSNNDCQTAALLLGGTNLLTKYGQGNLYGLMAGGINAATHVGSGNVAMAQLGGGNLLTKVGQGDLIGAQFGAANMLTHVGNGKSLGLMAGGGNVFTKVGDGLSAALMLGATANVYTHVGSGDSVAVMASGGNIFTKVDTKSETSSGSGKSVADDITAAAMLGVGNTFTHVGNGTTGALMVAEGNLFTKVGDGNTATAMLGLGNIATHVGDGTTVALMAAQGNVLTKVGDGTTAAVMAANGNLFSHIGDGNTTSVALGQANIITKVGQGDQVNAVMGKANVLTHVSSTDINSDNPNSDNSYNLVAGDANVITKVGDGKQVNIMQGKANIVTHVGNGKAINLALGGWANVITKVGDGDTVAGIVGSKANVITHMGNGNDYQGIWGEANIVTKVGDGITASAMKGMANVVTSIGNGAQVGLLWGDANVVTKVGDGSAVNLMKGSSNTHTKVGDGDNVAVMKGIGNVNVQVGDGTTAFVAYANNNISVQIGDGDYYGFTFAKGKLTALQNAQAMGRNILQTAGGFVGSGVISQLIWGAEATGHSGEESGSSNENSNENSHANSQSSTANAPDEQVNNTGDVEEKIIATPFIVEPQFNFSDYESTPAFDVDAKALQVSEPDTSLHLNKSNLAKIDSSGQSQEAEASRAAALTAQNTIEQGINDSKRDIEKVFDALESTVGEGGVLQSTLNELANTLTDQLSGLDQYVGELDAVLSTKKMDNEGAKKAQAEFANGVIGGVNDRLGSTLTDADQALSDSNEKLRDAKLHIENVKQDAEQRQTGANRAQTDANQAQQAAEQQQAEANNRVSEARAQADGQSAQAKAKADSTSNNAKGAKLSDGDKPKDRHAAKGSGLSESYDTIDTDIAFTHKTDAELESTAQVIINASQQESLINGVSGIHIPPQLPDVPGVELTPEQEEEEEQEEQAGGLTDEQIAALHEAERANNNLGLQRRMLVDSGVDRGVVGFDEVNFFKREDTLKGDFTTRLKTAIKELDKFYQLKGMELDEDSLRKEALKKLITEDIEEIKQINDKIKHEPDIDKKNKAEAEKIDISGSLFIGFKEMFSSNEKTQDYRFNLITSYLNRLKTVDQNYALNLITQEKFFKILFSQDQFLTRLVEEINANTTHENELKTSVVLKNMQVFLEGEAKSAYEKLNHQLNDPHIGINQLSQKRLFLSIGIGGNSTLGQEQRKEIRHSLSNNEVRRVLNEQQLRILFGQYDLQSLRREIQVLLKKGRDTLKEADLKVLRQFVSDADIDNYQDPDIANLIATTLEPKQLVHIFNEYFSLENDDIADVKKAFVDVKLSLSLELPFNNDNLELLKRYLTANQTEFERAIKTEASIKSVISDDQVALSQNKSTLLSLLSDHDKAVAVRMLSTAGLNTALNKILGQFNSARVQASSYLDISMAKGSGAGVNLSALRARVKDAELKKFVSKDHKSARGRSKHAVRNAMGVSNYAEAVAQITHAKGYKIPVVKSENHILAHSFIPLVLAEILLSDRVNANSADKLIDALTGLNSTELAQNIQIKTASRQLSQVAKQAFSKAVEAKQQDNAAEARKYLNIVMDNISYAPGNIRYGDRTVNGEKSNYFDGAMKLVTNDNGEKELRNGEKELRYRESPRMVAEALFELEQNQLISEDLSQKARMADTSKLINDDAEGGFLYSSNDFDEDGVRVTLGADEYRLGEMLLRSVQASVQQQKNGSGLFSTKWSPGKKWNPRLSFRQANRYRYDEEIDFSSTFFVADGESPFDPEARKHTHKLNEDGKSTYLSQTDPRYKLHAAGGDFVVYQFTVDGKVTYRVVNTADDYSLYMTKAPVITDGKLRLDGMTAKVFAHGTATDQTYTPDQDAPRLSHYAPEGKNLISNPSALVDDPNPAHNEIGRAHV